MMSGKSFLSPECETLLSDLVLREEAREQVAEAKGRLVKSVREIPEAPIVSVGDRVTSSLLENGRRPEVAIIDLKERRSVVASAIHLLSGYLLLSTSNPPGRITRESWRMVKLAIDMASNGFRVALVVDGEEDLLGFPATLVAPLGWLMLYGQPGIGMILVEIDDHVKMEAKQLLTRAFRPL